MKMGFKLNMESKIGLEFKWKTIQNNKLFKIKKGIQIKKEIQVQMTDQNDI